MLQHNASARCGRQSMQSLQTSGEQIHLWSANQYAVQEMGPFQRAKRTRYAVHLSTLAFGQLSGQCNEQPARFMQNLRLSFDKERGVVA